MSCSEGKPGTVHLVQVTPMGLRPPVHANSGVDSLSTANTDDLGYVREAIQNVVRALAGKVPVIGFVGAPFTLASYMIEGGASRLAQLHPHQAHDVFRRDLVAPADGQDRGRAGPLRQLASERRGPARPR